MEFFSFCRIADDLTVQICDYGLSRDLFPQDYHCLGDNENRPVKWMAIEALERHEFSSASDVVSYSFFACFDSFRSNFRFFFLCPF